MTSIEFMNILEASRLKYYVKHGKKFSVNSLCKEAGITKITYWTLLAGRWQNNTEQATILINSLFLLVKDCNYRTNKETKQLRKYINRGGMIVHIYK
jgi:hypothetical protein